MGDHSDGEVSNKNNRNVVYKNLFLFVQNI